MGAGVTEKKKKKKKRIHSTCNGHQGMEDRTSLVHVIAGVVVQSCHSKGIKKKSHVETESWPPIMKNPKLFLQSLVVNF